jgi:hypothetical protein
MRDRFVLLGGAVGLAFCFLAFPAKSHADTIIYSNLGTSNSYDGGTAWNVLPPPPSVAVPFTPSVAMDLSQILIALTVGGDNNCNIYGACPIVTLNSNSGGLPGAVIESWTLSPLPDFGSVFTIQPNQTLTSTPGVLLSGGSEYWIVATGGRTLEGITEQDVWNFNNTGDGGTMATNYLNSGWVSGSASALCGTTTITCVRAAFEVTGTTATSGVPEPSTWLLLGISLASVAAWRQMKRSCDPSQT